MMPRRRGASLVSLRSWLFLWGCLLLLAVSPISAQQESPSQAQEDLPGGSEMVRGTILASSADGFSVKTEKGEVYRVIITSNTRMMKARQPIKISEIHAGDGLGAMGVMDSPKKTLHALFVSIIDAEQLKKAQADLGKTYIAGQVTAINELKLTIRRVDGVTQTIAVDEGTSFRRGGRGNGRNGRSPSSSDAGGQGLTSPSDGGESVTLADIKVGDGIVGKGALKEGTFIPTELRIVDPERRHRSSADSGSSFGTVPPSFPR